MSTPPTLPGRRPTVKGPACFSGNGTCQDRRGAGRVVGMDEYDVVVIGGGAAGLSGAVALGRSRRSVLVVDDGTPRNAPAEGVHNFLSRDGTPPGELLAAGRAEVASYGGEIRSGRAVGAERVDGGFAVRLADGGSV